MQYLVMGQVSLHQHLIDRVRDRQTDRESNIQTDRVTDMLTNRQTEFCYSVKEKPAMQYLMMDQVSSH